MLLVFEIKASAAVRYVDLNSANSTPPYTDWLTAATNIQDVIDASSDGDQILVADGVYQTGGRVVSGSLTNRVVVNKAITLQSANGPAVTVIQGYRVPGTTNGNSAVCCVYLTNNAVLIGFTWTNGATRAAGTIQEENGGGAWCEGLGVTLSNCVLAGNSASNVGGGANAGTLNNCILAGNTATKGGGASGCTLNNCTLSGNSGSEGGGAGTCTLNNCLVTGNKGFYGGDAHSSTLNNCVLTRNTAIWGAGANGSTLNNCSVIGNQASDGGGGVSSSRVNNSIVYYNTGYSTPDVYNSTLRFCCTMVIPSGAIGVISNAPLFMDRFAGDFHFF